MLLTARALRAFLIKLNFFDSFHSLSKTRSGDIVVRLLQTVSKLILKLDLDKRITRFLIIFESEFDVGFSLLKKS